MSDIAEPVRRSVGKNALRLFSGSALGQVFSLAAAPLLTRLFTPEEYGILGLVTAVLMVTSSLITLRYELGFPSITEDDEFEQLLILCFSVVAVCSILTTVGLGIVVYTFNDIPPWLKQYWWAIPGGMVAIGSYNTLIAAATQKQYYDSITKTRIWQGLGSACAQVGFGYIGAGTTGLIIGFILGQSGGILVLAKALGHRGISAKFKNWRAIIMMGRRFRTLPLHSSWAGVLDAAGSGYLLTLFFGLIYSPEIVGYLFLAERVVGRPLLMSANSLLIVYMGELSQSISSTQQGVRRLFLSVLKKQATISSIWLFVILIGANYFVVPFFGAKWAPAAQILQLMAVAFWPQSVWQSVAHTLPILGLTSIAAMWSVGRFLGVLFAFSAALLPYGSPALVLSTYAGAQILFHAILLIVSLRMIDRFESGVLNVGIAATET